MRYRWRALFVSGVAAATTALSLYPTTGWGHWRLLIIALTFVVSLITNTFAIVRPAKLRDERYRHGFAAYPLRELQTELTKLHPGVTYRTNVMIARHKGQGPFGLLRWFRGTCELEMVAYVGEYTDAEKQLRYAPGEGSCGTAFRDGRLQWYDRNSDHDHLLLMPAIHADVTKHVNSVLSFPIWDFGDDTNHSGNPIGVLNVDSMEGKEDSHVNSADVQTLAQQTAATLGELL